MNKNRRNTISIVFVLMLLFSLHAYAQAPDTIWSKIYGWSGTTEVGMSIHHTNDNGYIIAGYNQLLGGSGYDVWLVKTDGDGDTVWTRTYGGGSDDIGKSVQPTTDGGYIIGGYTWSYGAGNYDIYLIKTNGNGDTSWTKTYGGSNREECQAIRQTSDGGYIAVGYTESFGAGDADVWILKTNPLGDTIWTRAYGGTAFDIGCSVDIVSGATGDSVYTVVGRTNSFGAGGADVWLLQLASNGDTIWTKTYGVSGSTEIGEDVQRTSDGGYIITGYKYGDLYLLKTTNYGILQWEKTYGTQGGALYDRGWSVQETTDGGYIIAGYTESFGAGDKDLWVLKTDANGDTVWTKVYGGAGYDAAGRDHSIQQVTDSTYVVVGATESFGPGGFDLWILYLGPATGVVEQKDTPMHTTFLPATVITGPLCVPSSIRYEIFDVTGRHIDPLSMQTGIYYLVIDGVVREKLIKIR